MMTKFDRKLSQGFVDFKKLSTEELRELIERQEKLIRKRSFIEKLPDRGEKIMSFKNQVQIELDRRKVKHDSVCHLLSHLSLHDQIDEIEWNERSYKFSVKQFDSDDDDDDSDKERHKYSDDYILKLITSHSGILNSENKDKKLNTNESENFKLSYKNKLFHKCDNATSQPLKFKPNQLKEDNTDLINTSALKVKKKLGKMWEVTQATPPITRYKTTKEISLLESIELQEAQAQKLKEEEIKRATEKLILHSNIKFNSILPSKNINKYRDHLNNFEENDEDEESQTKNSEDDDFELQ